MRPVLTLLIPPGWPAAGSACAWILRDAQGRVLRQGCSAPAHWPGVGSSSADDERNARPACVVLLTGAQSAVHRVRLPRTPKGHAPDILASALEDCVLEPAARLHYAVDPRGAAADGLTGVAVVSASRLAELRQALSALELPLVGVWPLAYALDRGSAWLAGSAFTIVTKDGASLALGTGEPLAAWLAELAAQGALPQPLPWATLESIDDQASRALVQAGARLQARERATPPLPPAGAGLLYGDVAAARPGSPIFSGLRRTRRVAAGFAVLLALLAAVQVAWLALERRGQMRDIEAQFRRVLPRAPQVDAIVQLQREVDAQRRRHGQLAGDDFLWLLAVVTAPGAAPIAPRELRYEQGRLHVTATLDEGQRAALNERCRRAGLQVGFDGGAAGAALSTVVISRSLRP